MKLIDKIKAYFNWRKLYILALEADIGVLKVYTDQLHEDKRILKTNLKAEAIISNGLAGKYAALLQDYADRSADFGSALLEKAAAEKMIDLAAKEMIISREIISDLKNKLEDKKKEVPMTPEERIKHEFLLLQSKLGEDAVMFLHLDECPTILDDAFNVSYACNTWSGITSKELEKNFETGMLKELVRQRMIHALLTGKDVIDELIIKLEQEKSDAEETKDIGEQTTDQRE